MKKYIIVLVLMLMPMVSFAAPSVRVLGSGTGTPASSTTGAKVTPAKTSSVAKTAATTTNAAAGARIGTLRATPKVSTAKPVAASTANTARFPVITPAHSYSSVTKPQAVGGGKTVINNDVNLDNYYNKEEVNNNYYNKEEVDNIVNELKDEDDPRFDMVRVSVGNPRPNWVGNPKLEQREGEGYVFMWIEE